MENTLVLFGQEMAVVDGSLHSDEVARALGLPVIANPLGVEHPIFVISTGPEARALLGLSGKVDGAGVVAWELDEGYAMELLNQGFRVVFGQPTPDRVLAAFSADEPATRARAEAKDLCARLADVERAFSLASPLTQR